MFTTSLNKVLLPADPDLLKRLKTVRCERWDDDGELFNASLGQIDQLVVRVRLYPDRAGSRQPRLESDRVLSFRDVACRGDPTSSGETLRAVAVAVRLHDRGAAVLLTLAQQPRLIGALAMGLRDTVEGHEQMIVLLAAITNDVADDGGVRINVGRVIKKGRDGVQVWGGIDLSSGLVHDLNGGSRGGAGVLRVHGDDDDSVDAPCSEVFHDSVDVRLTVLHSNGDVVLLTEDTRELLSEVLRVEQQRGTAVRVPDGCVGLC